MAGIMSHLLRYASWFLPYGALLLRRRILLASADKSLLSQDVFAQNSRLKNKHSGQRCFIVGNGSSIKNIDLSRLHGEIVFSVSNGYLHEGYDMMSPLYHCLPQISYGRMTEDDVVSWFREMESSVGNAELFLNETEANLVREKGFFAANKVHYLALRGNFDELNGLQTIDISRPVPRVQSVPIMALMIAMYMGFQEIILLGMDHDSWRTGYYNYPFRPKATFGKDFSVTDEGKVLTKNYDTFQSHARLWRQYRYLSKVASANNVMIANASFEGELDEFPRRSLEYFDV